VKVQFISSIAIISPRPAESRQLFVDTLGLPLEQAAEACFGTRACPKDRIVPQVSIEFDVASEAEVSLAAAELEARGYRLLHQARTEPWGQTVARLQTPEGAIVGVSYAPSLRAATTPAVSGQTAQSGRGTLS
jgi:catechol 2,3-dioxygenase-like lactoylglutathione lyase family enzyme